MNTLTLFIGQNLIEGVGQRAETQGKGGQSESGARYEVIENEVLKNSEIKGLSISGSLFSLTTFTNVTFESCVFFGSRMENCIFINCTFVDCRFQFTNIAHCKFNGCEFKQNTWELSPIKKCNFAHSLMDAKTAFFANKEDNHLLGCRNSEELTWEDVLLANSSDLPPPIPSEDEDDTEVIVTNWLLSKLKKAA